MVWLDVAGDNGSALYFVAERIERLQGRQGGLAVYGLVGDGQYEGQLLVEIGATVEVTFFDGWLAAGDFSRFVQRVDRERMTEALAEAAVRVAAGMHGGISALAARGNREGFHDGGRVAETRPDWRKVA